MVALRNIVRAWLRSLITIIGMGGGVALYLCLSVIAGDLKSQINEATSAYRLDMLIYESKATSPLSSRIGAGRMEELQRRIGPALVPLVLGNRNEPWSAYTLVIGAPASFARRIPLLQGEVFHDEKFEILIGEIAAQRLQIQVGKAISFDGHSFHVTGIFRTGSRLLDGGFLGSLPLVQSLLSRSGEESWYTMAVLQAIDSARAMQIKADVSGHWPELKVIPAHEFAGSLRLLRVVDAFVDTLSVIAMVGVCLICTNTLIMAVNERTRDIGVLLAIGWTPFMILRMLLIEGAVLGALSLITGLSLAKGLLWGLNAIPSIGYGWIPQSIPWPMMGIAGVLLAAVLILSLLWPAYLIWRLQPIEAIRRD